MRERYTSEQLSETARLYLEGVCNMAVDCLTAEKCPPTRIHANIKVLTTLPGSPDIRYEVIARSRHPDRERVAYEERHSEPCRLNENAYYQKIVVNQGITDCCPVPDIDKFIEAWKAGKEFFVEPNPHAPNFYKSALIVAIKGHLGSARLAVRRAAIPFGEDKVLLGFICIDSKEINLFEDEWDLDVMRQLAGDAFAALQEYYRAEVAVGTPALRLVPSA